MRLLQSYLTQDVSFCNVKSVVAIVCSYYVSRLDRHVTYYTSHMLYNVHCTYVDTRPSLPILKYTVVARLLTCLHISTRVLFFLILLINMLVYSNAT